MHPKTKVEAKEHLLNVLTAIQLTKENFRENYIKDILLGNETDEILAHHHDALEVFGAEEDEDEHLLNAVINQAVLAEYIVKNVEDYGVLKLTDKAYK